MLLRIAALLLLLGVAWGDGLRGEAPEGLPATQILNQRNGFTGAYPRTMIRDAEGRLWVATDLGLLFVGDGVRFLKVNLPDVLRGSGITGLSSDPQGRIWLLSTTGLGTWERGEWRVDASIRDREMVARRRTSGVFDRPDGTQVMLASGKAYRLPLGGRPTPMPLPGTEAEGEPSLAWQGDRLVANRGGLFWREDGQQWAALPTLVLQGSERPQGPVQCDAKQHLYMLTDQHLYHLAPGAETWKALAYTPSQDADRMSRLGDGCIWILQNGRALRGQGGVLTQIPLPADLSLLGASALCLDDESNLWIARTDLLKIPALGLVLSHAGSGYPPAREVWHLRRDGQGPLWVTSEAGMFRRDAQGWQAVPGLQAARDIDEGPEGWLYIRNRRKLVRVEPRTLRAEEVVIPLAPGGIEIRRGPVVSGHHMWVMDPMARVLMGTWIKGTWSWAWDTLPEGIFTSAILRRDECGRPWLIHEHGAYIRADGHWEKVPLPDNRGLVDLTFPTPDAGLGARFNPPTVYALERTSTGWSTRQLLGPQDLRGIGTLYSVRQDPKGTIWLNTDRGVVCADLGPPIRLQRFGTEVGLPAEDTNQGALLLDAPGHAWVGTVLGLAEIRRNAGPTIPPLAAPSLLEARCGDWVQQGPEPSMTIRHGQGSLVWELGFPGPIRGEGARFEFREAGGTWATLAGTALQFPEISPGHHSYEVRVLPFLGGPGPSRRLEIHVLPPWYRHPLAYAVWVLILAGSVYMVVRWRLARLQRRNRELSLAVDQATEGLRARERDLELVNRRLYELNDAKNRIIGLAAHDLRNPLSGILLYCDLLQVEVTEPEAVRSLGAIRTLGATMKDLIQRLLDVHAIEAGHAEVPQLASLDLQAKLEVALERAHVAAERKGITLDFHPLRPAQCRGDIAQVGQILDNFLSNAIKFSPAGTQITLSLEDLDTHWRASVKDQGPGLTTTDLNRVFGEYARLSAQPTAGESSVGLGLSLVKRMAEAMGGAVGVESLTGQGATFWLDLPKA